MLDTCAACVCVCVCRKVRPLRMLCCTAGLRWCLCLNCVCVLSRLIAATSAAGVCRQHKRRQECFCWAWAFWWAMAGGSACPNMFCLCYRDAWWGGWLLLLCPAVRSALRVQEGDSWRWCAAPVCACDHVALEHKSRLLYASCVLVLYGVALEQRGSHITQVSINGSRLSTAVWERSDKSFRR